MRLIATLGVVLALVAPARADCEVTAPLDGDALRGCLEVGSPLSRARRVELARQLGRATGDDRDVAIALLLHAALTDHRPLRTAIRKALVRTGGLSARAARRLPSRARFLGWLSRQLARRELSMTMVYTVVVTGEPSPGTLRISAIPEACDDDFYVWADADLAGDWTLVDANIGNDC